MSFITAVVQDTHAHTHTHTHPHITHTSCNREDNNKRGHRRYFCMNTEMVRNDHTMAFS